MKWRVLLDCCIAAAMWMAIALTLLMILTMTGRLVWAYPWSIPVLYVAMVAIYYAMRRDEP